MKDLEEDNFDFRFDSSVMQLNRSSIFLFSAIQGYADWRLSYYKSL